MGLPSGEKTQFFSYRILPTGEKTQFFSYRMDFRVFEFWLEFGLILYLDSFFVCKILSRVLREDIPLITTKLKTSIFECLIIFGFKGGGGGHQPKLRAQRVRRIAARETSVSDPTHKLRGKRVRRATARETSSPPHNNQPPGGKSRSAILTRRHPHAAPSILTRDHPSSRGTILTRRHPSSRGVIRPHAAPSLRSDICPHAVPSILTRHHPHAAPSSRGAICPHAAPSILTRHHPSSRGTIHPHAVLSFCGGVLL